AIQTRFGGNDVTKKTQKTLLKQMYENFNAPSTESLDSIFNRLQKIVSQLAILGENISQEDLNLKFMRILPSEWNTHVNMAFVTTPSSTNEVNTANVQVNTANSTVSTDSTLDSTSNLSDATVYAFLANQPNGFEVAIGSTEYESKKVLPERIGKKITINESDTARYDKSKVECFNYHKMGHFARECRGPRNQESMVRNQDNSRRTVNVKDISSKAMVVIDGAGFDWSYMADEEVPTNLALMAFSDSEIENFKKEKESNQIKIDNFENASKSLDKLIGSQISDNNKKGCGFKANKGVYENSANKVKKSLDALVIEDWVSNCDEDESEETFLPTNNLNDKVNTAKVNSVNIAKGNRVTSAVGEKGINVVKSSACWVWRPKIKV
ncbi:putative ribonuclease H-like domain-containing protein, partial [Tanacetum coccineum]